MSTENNDHRFLPFLIAFPLLVACVFVLFGSCLTNGNLVPWAADYGMPSHRGVVEAIRGFGGFFWAPTYYLGYGNVNGTLLYPHWPILAVLPVSLSFTVNIALHLLWAGLGGWFCSRALGVGKWGAAISAVAFGLSTHAISLIYPGHIAKIQAIVWIPWTIGFFWKAWSSGKPRDFLLCAVCFAPALQSGEPQIPLYLGFYLPVIALIGAWSVRSRGLSPLGGHLLKRFCLSLACAALTSLLAFQAISTYSAWMGGVRPGTVAEKTTSEEPVPDAAQDKAKWDFATGWSFPPEDSLTFLLTGQFFGGRSPGYFGRMGTDTMTLKETDDYVGVLVVFLALLALGGIRKNRAIGFLLFVLLTSLIIGYGRYTPVYRAIFALPTMASQRIPARWIALTTFAFAMLAGFGLERILAVCRTGTSGQRKRYLALPACMGLTALLLLILQFSVGAGSEGFAEKAFGTSGFLASSSASNLATLRAERFVDALKTAEILLMAGAAILLVGLFNRFLVRAEPTQRRLVQAVAAAAVLLTGIDLTLNAKHFVEPYNWRQYHQGDGLVQMIQRDPDLFRVQPLGTQRHPVLNRLVGPVGSWNRLRLTEQTSMNVLPADITKVQTQLKTEKFDHRFSPRYYDLFNVKYILSAFNLPPEMLTQMNLSLSHRIPYGQRTPPLFLYQYNGFTPNPAFISSTRSVDTEEELLELVCSPAFSPATTVAGIDLPTLNGGSHGQATLKKFGRTSVDIEARTDGPGWIVMKERFHKYWTATVNGKPADVHRLNLLHFGVPVEAGQHNVQFTFSPPRTKLLVASTAWVFALLGACLPLLGRVRSKDKSS